MRAIQSSEAKAHFTRLLTEVENGETVVITRHGRPIARVTPETRERAADLKQLKAAIAAFRKTMPPLSAADIAAARREGQK